MVGWVPKQMGGWMPGGHVLKIISVSSALQSGQVWHVMICCTAAAPFSSSCSLVLLVCEGYSQKFAAPYGLLETALLIIVHTRMFRKDINILIEILASIMSI